MPRPRLHVLYWSLCLFYLQEFINIVTTNEHIVYICQKIWHGSGYNTRHGYTVYRPGPTWTLGVRPRPGRRGTVVLRAAPVPHSGAGEPDHCRAARTAALATPGRDGRRGLRRCPPAGPPDRRRRHGRRAPRPKRGGAQAATAPGGPSRRAARTVPHAAQGGPPRRTLACRTSYGGVRQYVCGAWPRFACAIRPATGALRH